MDKSTNNITKSHKTGSFIDWITQYESLVVFSIFGVSVMATIILNGLFQAGPMIRNNLLYNAFGALILAGGFIYVILNINYLHYNQYV